MKLRRLIIPALACLLMTQAVPAALADEAAATPIAVLMSCAGPVTVHRADGKQVPGSFGLQLHDGDEVKTGADATAEIFFQAGNWLQLGAGSNIQIKGQRDGSAPKGAPISQQKKIKTDKSGKVESSTDAPQQFEVATNFLKLKDSGGTSAIVGLRSKDKDDELVALSPCHTRIREANPTFRWNSADPTAELLLTVYHDGGVHWQTKVQNTTAVAYPADAPALEPGAEYSWTLESTDPLMMPPLRSHSVFFEVMRPEDCESLDASLARISEDAKLSAASQKFLRASVFFNHGAIEDAIAETEAAIAKDPENTALQSILAKLYTEAGRTKDAVQMYDRMMAN